ncbi:MaoC-like protein [Veillonellaceae bacterium DNF00751]|uniref:MaoC-like protein n=1 Tax=Megasphaera lornae TaxID=1000568 RepID=D3LTA6_9FIRM|nr:MaoC family dehydratase [Megasphaera genomosp. type_1]EFD94445.1 MaoC-like protein [Megasphaera genomosp. type_1 str. 28L]KXB92221.1 MaoC-like protein [Veillonellaceae bacterium DNF00751]
MNDIAYRDITVGMTASLKKTITQADVEKFAAVTGDYNPLHMDEEFAGKTIFRGRIAHGMITGGLISAVLGTELPGKNTLYLEQELKFLAPVRFGDTLVATVECIEKEDRRHKLVFKTVVTNQNGTVVTSGKALVRKR